MKAWHGERVVVTGYMVPTKLEQGRVKELMLMRHTFAAGNVSDPWINEWVLVRVRAGVPAQTRRPVSFFGVMKVGAVFEQGYMIGIYMLEAERMDENGF